MTIETVKIINGQEITRYAGTKGQYFVNVKEDNGIGWKEFHTFSSLKKAKEFCERVF